MWSSSMVWGWSSVTCRFRNSDGRQRRRRRAPPNFTRQRPGRIAPRPDRSHSLVAEAVIAARRCGLDQRVVRSRDCASACRVRRFLDDEPAMGALLEWLTARRAARLRMRPERPPASSLGSAHGWPRRSRAVPPGRRHGQLGRDVRPPGLASIARRTSTFLVQARDDRHALVRHARGSCRLHADLPASRENVPEAGAEAA